MVISMKLNEQALCAYLTPDARAFYHITIADEVSSTNTVLKSEAADGAPQGTVLIARRQSGGRGRLGRTFHSPKETGLYLSILTRPTIPARDALHLTTSTAAVCADAVDACRSAYLPSPAPAKIKWVNDLYLQCGDTDGTMKKIAGILCESALQDGGNRLDYAVIGIGVNLLPPPTGFPQEIAGIAGALFKEEEAAFCDPNLLAAEILNGMLSVIIEPCAVSLTARYRARSLLDGQRILVRPASSQGETVIPATCIGIAEDLGLCVRYDDGRDAVLYSGEVERIRLS